MKPYTEFTFQCCIHSKCVNTILILPAIIHCQTVHKRAKYKFNLCMCFQVIYLYLIFLLGYLNSFEYEYISIADVLSYSQVYGNFRTQRFTCSAKCALNGGPPINLIPTFVKSSRFLIFWMDLIFDKSGAKSMSHNRKNDFNEKFVWPLGGTR